MCFESCANNNNCDKPQKVFLNIGRPNLFQLKLDCKLRLHGNSMKNNPFVSEFFFPLLKIGQICQIKYFEKSASAAKTKHYCSEIIV